MIRKLQAQLQALFVPAFAERLTLVINHVLGAEEAAVQRLRPHAGRVLALSVSGWPALLPAPPALAWRVTPAGLLEWVAQSAPADLSVRLDAPNPAALLARALAGEAPPLQIEGDAQLAGDVNWLLQNLRWDVAADLERFFGPVAAHQLHKLGSALAGGLRAALKGVAELGGRLRSRGA
jgi:ubiquinone biosynthesis protein UbiJ